MQVCYRTQTVWTSDGFTGPRQPELLNFRGKWQYIFKEKYVLGRMGSLCLPSTSANGGRKRATCGQVFRIKGAWALQNLKRKPRGYAPSGLSPVIRIKFQYSSVSFVGNGFFTHFKILRSSGEIGKLAHMFSRHVCKTFFHSLTSSTQHYHSTSHFKIHSLHVGSCDNHHTTKQLIKNQTMPYATPFSELAANATT